jgi:hypothetical protein
VQRLRLLLKIALRAFALKAERITPVVDGPGKTGKTRKDPGSNV